MPYEIIKRLMDIFMSIILIIIFSPVMLLTAIIIKTTSKGPILVEKENAHMLRIGKNGKIFRLLKFRSMLVNSDMLIVKDPRFNNLYAEWRNTNYKLNNDPRVTTIGKFIRKYSVDETPQLFNVLKGEMSLVGPRPYHSQEIKEQIKRYPGTEKFVKQTQTVKPGITGYWQVNGRSNINFDKRIRMDAEYALKKSIWDDMIIIAKTPLAMISAHGAV